MAVIVLAGLEVLYVAVGNWALDSGALARFLSRRPERFQIAWSSGRTVWPGIFHLKGVTFRGQSELLQSSARLDRCTLRMHLLLLAACRVQFYGMEGEGFSLWIRHRREPGKPHLFDRFEPPVPGLRQDAPPPKRKPYPSPWSLHFSSVSVTDVREIWIGPYKITGHGHLDGEVSYRMRGALALQKATLLMDGARMELGEEILASDMHAELDARIDSVVPRKHRGRSFLTYVSGRYRVSGYVASLGFLNDAFGKKVSLFFNGRGHLSMDASVNRGVSEPGSSLSWEGKDLSASAAGFSIQGKGGISGGIGGASGRAFSLIARWSTITLVREGLPPISLDGPGLTATLSGPQLDLASDSADLTVALDLPDSGIKDLSLLSGFLPQQVPFTILPGSGARLQGHVEIHDKSAKGDLSIAGEEAGVGLGAEALRGGFFTDLIIADGNLETNVFDISGSKIGFRNGAISNSRDGTKDSPWSGEAQLSEATLHLTLPASFQASVAFSMKDTRPAIALFAPDHSAVRWFKDFFNIKDVTGSAELITDGKATMLDTVAVQGEGLQMLGRLRIKEGKTDGAFYIELHHFSAAARITDGKTNWKLINARQWYESQPGF